MGTYQEEPGSSGTEKDASILPLPVKAAEVSEAGLGLLESLSILSSVNDSSIVGDDTFLLAVHVSLNIDIGLLDIPSHVESVSGGLRDGQTEVKSNDGWDSTHSWTSSQRAVNLLEKSAYRSRYATSCPLRDRRHHHTWRKWQQTRGSP